MSPDTMREVDRKSDTWWFIHKSPGGHDNRSHPQCPWCMVRNDKLRAAALGVGEDNQP